MRRGMRLRALSRSLRFRLALSYVVIFAGLMSLLGLFERQQLSHILDAEMHDVLQEEWGALKSYLKIENENKVEKLVWFYDPTDTEETAIVARLQRVFFFADAKGEERYSTSAYQELGVESPAKIRAALKSKEEQWSVRKTKDGEPYLVRGGWFFDNGHMFYASIGRSIAEHESTLNTFTWKYFTYMPAIILISCLLGWYVAGRVMVPLEEVARTAQKITGSNLSIQIPMRGANDELDHLIRTFNHMVERLDASFTQAKQFSTDVSHELRTPLTAIRGQLEVAMFAAKTVEQYQDAISNALQDVERLSRTIRALLLLSQAETGQLALQLAPLDFAELVRDIVDQFQIPAEDADIRLEANLPPSLPVTADRVQIERLLSNLISNAIKYTPRGGSVRVEAHQEEEMVHFSVKDSGIGIPENHLPHIFDRFYRVPHADARSKQGLGLGLSFVAWIVKIHNGRIRVDSRLGEGACFEIDLPIAAANHEDAVAGTVPAV